MTASAFCRQTLRLGSGVTEGQCGAVVRAAREVGGLDSHLSPAAYLLWELGQVTRPLRASVASSVNRGC